MLVGQKLLDRHKRTMDGGSMAEASINNQPVLIWSEPVLPWAYYEQSQYGKAVLLLALPRRVRFSA